jgi:hypothetical protein
VAATANSASQITVNWTNVSNATSYNIYRSTSPVVQTSAANKISNVAAQATAGAFPNSGLSASTAYYYKVTAQNSAGESAGSVEVTATTSAAGTPPPIPTVTGFSPSSGAVGTVVTITGTNLGLGFQPAPIVKIGTSTVTTPITFNGQTSLSFTVPTGLAAAAYTITIGGATGTPITVGSFTVTAATGGAGSGGVGGGNIGGGAGRTMGGIATPPLPATLPTVSRLMGTNPSASIAAAWTAAKSALQAFLIGYPVGSYASESVDYVAQTYSKFGAVLVGNTQRAMSVEFGTLGLDGLPNTTDDVITGFQRFFYPTNSSVYSGFVAFNGAGADGVWRTADDLAAAATDSMNAVIGTDGLGHQFLIPMLMAGADRVFFTADDAMSNVGYDFISLNANGFGVQDVHYASAGVDATFFTADDVVSWYTVFNVDPSGNALQAITYFGAGVDGQWFTADDVVKTATAGVVSGGRLTHIANFGPGPDTIWFNADDTITGWDYYVYDAAGRVQLLITHASFPFPASAVSTLYDAAGRPVQVASHLAIGADNLWMTGDDNVMTNTVKEWDAAGNQIRQVQYNGKGADGLWFTADDVVTPGMGYWYATYEANGKKTLLINYSGVGADGLPFTADDVVTSYQINVYSATGVSQVSIGVNAMGADGRAFTADDVGAVFGISTNNAAGKIIKRVAYTGPGADGFYFTADDPISYYYTYTYDGQGRTLTYAYYTAAGADAVWQTADDVAASTSIGVYDAAGNSTTVYHDAAGVITTWYKATLTNGGLTTESIYYGTAGVDGTWQTSDDVVSGVTHYENNAAGSITVYGYGGLGVDGILNTADDYLPNGYTRYGFDVANVQTSNTQYSTAGLDGIWFTADDVKKTDYFYKLPLP